MLPVTIKSAHASRASPRLPSSRDAMKIMQAVKAHSLKTKKLLTEAEFRQVADGVLKQTAA